MILLDTHALYWLASDDAKLGAQSRARVSRELADGTVAVSAIAFWELAMLATRRRIEADDVEALRRLALDSGIVELPIDGPVAIRAAQLDTLHNDPADRFIAATALRHDATLITADEKLLAGPPELKRFDARR